MYVTRQPMQSKIDGLYVYTNFDCIATHNQGQIQKILIKGVECARVKARPLGDLGACSPRKILKFRSSEIDSSAFLRKKCDE